MSWQISRRLCCFSSRQSAHLYWQYLATTWIVIGILIHCSAVAAVAQERVPAKPSPQVKQHIAQLLDRTLPAFDIDPRRLPGRFERQVIKRVYEHTALYRRNVQKMLRRGAALLPMMKHAMKQHQLPEYFAYIPMVESAFRINALHPKSGARGLWQLMPATARGFGLEVSDEVDERIDPLRATQGAARYLKRLQERFGDKSPLHILAAYNHGDTNLARAMRRHGTRDIWHLYTYRRIPYETRNYMIKMVTLWVVVAHAEAFDFTLHETTSPAYSTHPGEHGIGLVASIQQ